jgi:polysaccharide biosynthesis transport protein
LELWRYYRILRRRRWLILLCMVVCIVAVYVQSKYMTPDTWTGRTRVMERQPNQTGVPVYNENYAANTQVEIHLADLAHIATSNSVITRAVASLEDLGITVEPDTLIRTLTVEPVQDTQILQIEVTSPDRDEAKSAADVVAAEFRRFYSELVSGAAEQSREFIEKQLKETKKSVEKAREARRDYKLQHDVVELGAESQVLINRTAQIEADAIQAKVQQDDANSKLARINSQASKEQRMLLTGQSTANNPVYQELLNTKVKLETELGRQLATRGRKHPEVQSLEKQVAEVDGQIKAQAPMIVSGRNESLNPKVAQAMENQVSLSAESAGAGARKQSLDEALAVQKAKLKALPDEEVKMAQLELDVSSAEETYRLLRAKLDEARIKTNETQKASSIQMIDPAFVYPVERKIPLKMALALVLSPILGAALAFLLNYLDNTIKTPAEAEDLLGLPVVSVIPLARSHSLARRPDNEGLLASHEMLTATLWNDVAKSGQPTVVVASAEPETGRSVTAANLAITLARDGARVILVDADMRKPCLHTMFGIPNKPGLSNIVTGGVSIEDAVVPSKIEGLLLLPAGPAPDNPVRLLRSEKMADFVHEVATLADFVVFDTPAGVTFADAAIVASYAKNVVLVHAAGKVPRGGESEFRSKLDLLGANIVGVLLNKVRAEDCHGYFHYRRFYQDMTAQGRAKVAVAGGGVRAIPPTQAGDDEE